MTNYPQTMNSDEATQDAQDWQNEAQETTANLKDRARQTAKDLQERAQQWQKRAAETTRKAAEATDIYVHENPWTVIGSVAAAFFLLGVLVGRSRN